MIAVGEANSELVPAVSAVDEFYLGLDSTIADRLRSSASLIRTKKMMQVELILEIGKRLIEAKALLNYGQFGQWLEIEFSLSHRTATNYMSAAQRFGDRMEIISNLKPATVYRLAAPKTPDDLRQTILRELSSADKPP